MNLLCRDNDRVHRSPRKARSTSLHQCSSRPKPKRIETWVSPEILDLPSSPPSARSSHRSNLGPLDRVHVEPIGAIETQIVDLLIVPGAGGVEVGLDDRMVFAQELEIDLVLGPVALEGGEVEVEVEAAGVAAGAADLGAEGAVAEARGRAPPSAAAVVEGEGDGVGVGAVSAGLCGVVYGDLFQGLGLVERWSLSLES
ncbi:hypothetical protein PanWU01x14_011070 [Parasponia andersonii]|uniref:Uncharacterized protein n=1 Tax=Parasponia andersonii TaxID=3476 RepID=A0A2P5E1G1_PARAD|nr:hypothetical protein PanWU01x14_011070 [Parasponia andersonii]